MASIEERFEIAGPSRSQAGSTDSLLHGTTLLVPCVSIGSVPQLAVDALLANPGMRNDDEAIHVCDLDHRFCVPFVGAATSTFDDASAQTTLRTPLQVFTFPKAKVTVIQQRSPVLKTRKDDYVRALVRWIESHAFCEVVVLTSLDAGMRTDEQMSHHFWKLPVNIGSAKSTESRDSLAPLTAAMEAQLPLYRDTYTLDQAKQSSPKLSLPPLPAGGLARRYLLALSQAQIVTTSALVVFAAEGDNRADGMAMAHLLWSLLLVKGTKDTNVLPQIKEPADWALVFGGPIGEGLF